jgi:hypothetical protein
MIVPDTNFARTLSALYFSISYVPDKLSAQWTQNLVGLSIKLNLLRGITLSGQIVPDTFYLPGGGQTPPL